MKRRWEKTPATDSTLHTEAVAEVEVDSDYFVPRRDLNQLKAQYHRLLGDHMAVKRELESVKSENQQLRDQLKVSKFGFESLKDSTLCFFTGLQSIQAFLWLSTILKRTTLAAKGGFSWENHLLLVLMKVRHGLTNRDLAHQFGLPFSTASKIIREWIPVLSSALRPLIIWPSKDAVTTNMPKFFKSKFKKCRCIIDYTEVFIERSHDLQERAETWSTYKQQNTVKYLIGITPAGAISFLSNGRGGRTSNKTVTVNSGFLKKLEDGDVVLADRSVLIKEELASVGARLLRMPSFTKRKSQLSGPGVNTSRRLSRVRIHVEKVISHLKDFKILNTIIPISHVDMLDDIVTICACLANLRGTVVLK